MIKRILAATLAVILILSFAACGDKGNTNLPYTSTGDSTVLGTDFQKNMNQSTSYRIYDLCETDNGYYFSFNCIIYYMDKSTGEATVLCGKPDCSHEVEDCNAFANGDFLTYYNGKLYWSSRDYVQENGSVVDYGERVHCMDLDGTNHSVIQKLDFTPGGDTSGIITQPIIHRGSVYFAYSGLLYTVPIGDDIENAVQIYGEEIIDNGSMIANTNELWYELWADGDLVYFMAKNVKQSDGTYKDTLFCYDPQTQNLEKVWQVPDKSEVGSWDTTGVSVTQWYISNGYIYFYLSGNDVWATELSSGKTEKVVDLDISGGVASFSDEYIVILRKEVMSQSMDFITGGSVKSAGDVLFVYGYDGELVQEISLDQIYEDCATVSDCYILWVDEGKIYLQAGGTVSQPDKSYDLQTELIYSADIESGSLEKTNWSWSYGY